MKTASDSMTVNYLWFNDCTYFIAKLSKELQDRAQEKQEEKYLGQPILLMYQLTKLNL